MMCQKLVLLLLPGAVARGPGPSQCAAAWILVMSRGLRPGNFVDLTKHSNVFLKMADAMICYTLVLAMFMEKMGF